MKISVLIAAFQAGAFISKAIEGLREQWHADWELVVIEDGSHDETEAKVDEFSKTVPQSVRYLNLGKNQGVAVARNRLLALARGEAFAFLDADDWWSPHHLERLHGALVSGADVVVSGIELFDLAAGLPRERYTPPSMLFRKPVEALLEDSCIMTASSVGLRREMVERVGEFDPAFRIGEDRDYWLRCALAGGQFAHSGDVTCHYSKHASSTMAKTCLWAQQEVLFYEKHRRVRGVPDVIQRYRLAHCLENVGRLQRATDPVASAGVMCRAWMLAPWRPSPVLQFVYSAGTAALRCGGIRQPITRK